MDTRLERSSVCSDECGTRHIGRQPEGGICLRKVQHSGIRALLYTHPRLKTLSDTDNFLIAIVRQVPTTPPS